MAKEEKAKKVKRPTAEKRDITNVKKRMINRAFKSQVRTVMKNFETALAKGEPKEAEGAINQVYSMMDRGVKRGVFKQNKASRVKARAKAKIAKLSS